MGGLRRNGEVVLGLSGLLPGRRCRPTVACAPPARLLRKLAGRRPTMKEIESSLQVSYLAPCDRATSPTPPSGRRCARAGRTGRWRTCRAPFPARSRSAPRIGWARPEATIDEARAVPPPPGDVGELLSDLERFVHGAEIATADAGCPRPLPVRDDPSVPRWLTNLGEQYRQKVRTATADRPTNSSIWRSSTRCQRSTRPGPPRCHPARRPDGATPAEQARHPQRGRGRPARPAAVAGARRAGSAGRRSARGPGAGRWAPALSAASASATWPRTSWSGSARPSRPRARSPGRGEG
jgi:hypothetical protein